MKPSVDLTRWLPSHDVRGEPLAPGDYVSCPAFPRGTVRGTLRLSDRAWCVLPDGQEVGCLVIVTESGTVFNASGKTRKLKQEKKNLAPE